jgi:hypothetical protein
MNATGEERVQHSMIDCHALRVAQVLFTLLQTQVTGSLVEPGALNLLTVPPFESFGAKARQGGSGLQSAAYSST